MKKNYLELISPFLAFLLVIIGCQKEIKDEPIGTSKSELQSKGYHDRDKRECRLVTASVTDAVANFTHSYHYNAAGLCDEWTILDGLGTSVFKQKYDRTGRLSGSAWHLDGELMNTIVFTYKRNKVIKETWYVGNTKDVFDEIRYTYNAQGWIVKSESFLNDWYSVTKYSWAGNVLSVDLAFGGSPVYTAIMKYDRPAKNPYLSVPGIPHFFTYYTPTSFASKWHASAIKEIAYDIDGTAIVSFDYDPARTIWELSRKNNVLSTTYYDRLSESWFNYSFDYADCDARHSSKQPSPPSTDISNGKENDKLSLLRINPRLPVNEQFKQLRQELKHQLSR
jgi:hypothetical protein